MPVKIENRPFQVNTFRVVTLAPGDTQFIDVPVTRSSYKGPLQVKPDALPPGVTIKSMEIAAGPGQGPLGGVGRRRRRAARAFGKDGDDRPES